MFSWCHQGKEKMTQISAEECKPQHAADIQPLLPYRKQNNKKNSDFMRLNLETIHNWKLAIYVVFPYENTNWERWRMDSLVSLSEVVCSEFRRYWFTDWLILSMKIYEHSLGIHKCVCCMGIKQHANRKSLPIGLWFWYVLEEVESQEH